MNFLRFIILVLVNCMFICLFTYAIFFEGSFNILVSSENNTIITENTTTCIIMENGNCSYSNPYIDTIILVDMVGDKYVKSSNGRWYETTEDVYFNVVLNTSQSFVVSFDDGYIIKRSYNS